MTQSIDDFQTDPAYGRIDKITIRWETGHTGTYEAQRLAGLIAYLIAKRFGVPCTCPDGSAPVEITPDTKIGDLMQASRPCARQMAAYGMFPAMLGYLDFAAQYSESLGRGDGS